MGIRKTMNKDNKDLENDNPFVEIDSKLSKLNVNYLDFLNTLVAEATEEDPLLTDLKSSISNDLKNNKLSPEVKIILMDKINSSRNDRIGHLVKPFTEREKVRVKEELDREKNNRQLPPPVGKQFNSNGNLPKDKDNLNASLKSMKKKLANNSKSEQ